MNFPISTILGIALFILPGATASTAEAARMNEPGLSFGINRHLINALFVSLLLNCFWVFTIQLCPLFPNIDFEVLLNAMSGNKTSIVARVVERDLFRIVFYYLTLIAGSAVIGWSAPNIPIPFRGKPITFLPRKSGVQLNLSNGQNGIWCLVDVLTTSGKLYRGLFHSYAVFDPLFNGPSLNLSIASRWAADRLPPGIDLGGIDPIDEMEEDLSEEDTKNFEHESPENSQDDISLHEDEGSQEITQYDQIAFESSMFYDIRSKVTPFELGEMIYSSLEPYVGDDEVSNTLEGIFHDARSLNVYLERQIAIPPDICLPWGTIRNINSRHFELDTIKNIKMKLS
jgi:hypothetical protein